MASTSWSNCLDWLEAILRGRILFHLDASGEEHVAIRELNLSADVLPEAPHDPALLARLGRSVKLLGAQLAEVQAEVCAQLAGGASLADCVTQLLQTSLLVAATSSMVFKAHLSDQESMMALCRGALHLVLRTGRGILEAPGGRLGPGGRPAAVPALVSAQLSTLWWVLRLLGEPWNARLRGLVGRPGLFRCQGLVEALCRAGSALQSLGREEAMRMPAARVFFERFPCVISMLLDTEDMGFEDCLEASASCQRQLASHLLFALDWLFLDDTDTAAASEAAHGAPEASSRGSGNGSRGGGSRGGGGGGGGPAAAHSRGLANHTPAQRWRLAYQGLSSLACAELFRGVAGESSQGGGVRVLSSAGTVLRVALAEGALIPEDLFGCACFFGIKLAGLGSQSSLYPAGVPAAFRHGHPPEAGSVQQQAAAWAVLRLLPDLVPALQLLVRRGIAALQAAREGGQEADIAAADADTACFYATAALDPAVTAPCPTDVSQSAIWCQAAAAALRLLPLLSDMQLKFPEASAAAAAQRPNHSESIPELALRCATVWSAFIDPVAELHARLTRVPAGHDEVAAATAEPLWMLHTAAVRFVHWAAGQGERRLAKLFPDWDWRWMAMNLANTLQMAWEVNRMARATAGIAGDRQQEAELTRRMQAICAAHAPAIAVLGVQLGLRPDRLDIGFCLDLRFVSAAAPPPLQTPDLLSAFDACVRQVWRECSQQSASLLWERVHKVAIEAEEWPRFAALLLRSGLLTHGVRLAHDAGLPTARPQARQLLATLHVLCSNFGCACGRAVEGEEEEPAVSRSGGAGSSAAGAGTSAGSAVSEALRAMFAAVRQMEAAGGGTVPPASLALLQQYQQILLPAATRLATAMQAWWELPEQQAAAQLEATQAAATRSCAYLRCANLGGSGGPAAGQGEGSKRCSRCRSVRYCGTACSHADWQAGHRRMCKVLAEARQQQLAG